MKSVKIVTRYIYRLFTILTTKTLKVKSSKLADIIFYVGKNYEKNLINANYVVQIVIEFDIIY